MQALQSDQKTVLVTGANGYIGNAVARAFRNAGWKTYGLIRRKECAFDLQSNEIHPIIGAPADLCFLDQIKGVAFDVIVSNTEDPSDGAGHLRSVKTMIDQLLVRHVSPNQKPLVMFTSGCKDYGLMSQRHGDADLAPHTESSALNPPAALAPRTDFGTDLLAGAGEVYDAIVLRPTIVYGLSSSYYGSIFEHAASSGSIVQIWGDPNAVMHSCHVDDCAAAFVMLAEHPDRASVVGQAFNVSNSRYETAQEVADALSICYGKKIELVTPTEPVDFFTVHGLFNFWQWVGSDKLRSAIGWRERKPSFTDGIIEYRMAYEANRALKA